MERHLQTAIQCAPAALRKVAPLFAEPARQAILAAAQLCECLPTCEHLEQAREVVHRAAHESPIDSPPYAAGHAAAYAAAAAYACLVVRS